MVCLLPPHAIELGEAVRTGWDLLKTLGIRHRGVKVIACPSCARQGFTVIETVRTLGDRLAQIETPLTLFGSSAAW
jgi:(E)-4-hydroxy-3-methylbut-2-enyl-diphosphate synthase